MSRAPGFEFKIYGSELTPRKHETCWAELGRGTEGVAVDLGLILPITEHVTSWFGSHLPHNQTPEPPEPLKNRTRNRVQ